MNIIEVVRAVLILIVLPVVTSAAGLCFIIKGFERKQRTPVKRALLALAISFAFWLLFWAILFLIIMF